MKDYKAILEQFDDLVSRYTLVWCWIVAKNDSGEMEYKVLDSEDFFFVRCGNLWNKEDAIVKINEHLIDDSIPEDERITESGEYSCTFLFDLEEMEEGFFTNQHIAAAQIAKVCEVGGADQF